MDLVNAGSGVSSLILVLSALDRSYDPMDKETLIDLFGSKNVEATLACKVDFEGFSCHADRFEFHEYDFNAGIEADLGKQIVQQIPSVYFRDL